MGDIVDTSFIVQNLHHLNIQLESRPQYCQGYGCRNRQRDPEYEAVEERASSVGEQESGEDEKQYPLERENPYYFVIQTITLHPW